MFGLEERKRNLKCDVNNFARKNKTKNIMYQNIILQFLRVFGLNYRLIISR